MEMIFIHSFILRFNGNILFLQSSLHGELCG